MLWTSTVLTQISYTYHQTTGRSTPDTFNLWYDGGIFVGLYNPLSINSSIELYPEGTSVSFPLKSPTNTSNTILMKGAISSVRIPPSGHQLCLCDKDACPYTIWLVDGFIHTVSPEFLSSIVTTSPQDGNKICFPTWLGSLQKVMYLHEGIYKKGIMEWDLEIKTWQFSQRCHNGIEIFGVTLPNFCQSFWQYIDDGTLVPCWNGGWTFTRLDRQIMQTLYRWHN